MWGVCPGESKSMAESRKNRIAGFFGELLKMVRLVALFFGLYFGIYIAGAVFGLLENLRTPVIFAAAFTAGLVCFFLLPREHKILRIPAAGPDHASAGASKNAVALSGGTSKKRVALSAGTMAGIVFLSIFLTVWLNRLMFVMPWTEVLSEEQVASAEGNFEIPFLLSVIGYGLLAPFAEEVCFRGILYGYFSKWMKAPVAIAISALLFGLYHVNPVQGIYAALMGAVMALLVWLTGSLGASMLFHMTSNLLVVFYSSFTVLYDFILSPAGSVLTVLLGAGGVLVLILLYKGTNRTKPEGKNGEGGK